MFFAKKPFCAIRTFSQGCRRFAGIFVWLGFLLPFFFPFGVANSRENHSATYPVSLCELVENYLRRTADANPPLPDRLRNSLEQLPEILDAVDRAFHSNPARVPELLAKLRGVSQEISANEVSEHAVPLDEILLFLERRIVLYRLVYESLTETSAYTARTKADFDRIRIQTEELGHFFDELSANPAAKNWDEYLALSTLSEQLEWNRTFFENLAPKDSLAPERMLDICDTANLILSRLTFSFTPEQKQFLSHPSIVQWKRELDHWRDNTVHPLVFLAALEQYEQERLPSENETLSDFSQRLRLCPDENLHQLGKFSQTIYGGPNIKFFISEALINYLLPSRDPEFDRVHDVIVGRRVVGFRRTETVVKLVLYPAPDRLNMSLRITGQVSATGQSQVKNTKVTSGSYATFLGEKRLEWTEQGFQYTPATVGVNNRTYLRSVQTGVDGLPLLGNLVKEIAKNQFASQENQITAETRMKISRAAGSRIDAEVDERLREFNENFRKTVLDPMDRAGLSVERKDASTTNDWLLSSWRLSSDVSLGSHTLEPETIHGAFADFKVHESAVQTAIQSFNLAGKTMTVKQLREQIAEKIGRPQFAEEPNENDPVILAFAEKDPVNVRFQEGSIEITLSMNAMKVNRSVWKDFRFIVNYRPEYDDNGILCLVRDQGHVIGPKNAKTQLALRTVFAKIFPPSRTLPLVPPLFETDERFAQLTTGMCRLENGWFALAVVEKKTAEAAALESARRNQSRARK
ncbi:MAG: hypothetical protein FWC43_01465 [Planctomycetaceae bacterium]|nr:hypothetical protein [Planctomycetaceae bacterium]